MEKFFLSKLDSFKDVVNLIAEGDLSFHHFSPFDIIGFVGVLVVTRIAYSRLTQWNDYRLAFNLLPTPFVLPFSGYRRDHYGVRGNYLSARLYSWAESVGKTYKVKLHRKCYVTTDHNEIQEVLAQPSIFHKIQFEYGILEKSGIGISKKYFDGDEDMPQRFRNSSSIMSAIKPIFPRLVDIAHIMVDKWSSHHVPIELSVMDDIRTYCLGTALSALLAYQFSLSASEMGSQAIGNVLEESVDSMKCGLFRRALNRVLQFFGKNSMSVSRSHVRNFVQSALVHAGLHRNNSRSHGRANKNSKIAYDDVELFSVGSSDHDTGLDTDEDMYKDSAEDTLNPKLCSIPKNKYLLEDIINQVNSGECTGHDKLITTVESMAVSGTYAVGAALSWLLYDVASRPQVQLKLYDEIAYKNFPDSKDAESCPVRDSAGNEEVDSAPSQPTEGVSDRSGTMGLDAVGLAKAASCAAAEAARLLLKNSNYNIMFSIQTTLSVEKEFDRMDSNERQRTYPIQVAPRIDPQIESNTPPQQKLTGRFEKLHVINENGTDRLDAPVENIDSISNIELTSDSSSSTSNEALPEDCSLQNDATENKFPKKTKKFQGKTEISENGHDPNCVREEFSHKAMPTIPVESDFLQDQNKNNFKISEASENDLGEGIKARKMKWTQSVPSRTPGGIISQTMSHDSVTIHAKTLIEAAPGFNKPKSPRLNSNKDRNDNFKNSKNYDITWEQINSEWSYLDAVVKESLRLHYPGGDFLIRRANGEASVGHVAVPAGTDVVLLTRAPSCNEENFSRPYLFWPERWEADKKGGKRRFKHDTHSYVPLGSLDACGYSTELAEIQIKIFLVSLLRCYSISLRGSSGTTFEVHLPGLAIQPDRVSLELTLRS